MPDFLRVDLTSGRSSLVDSPPEYDGLGGRGLTSAAVFREVDPLANPIGPKNKLIFAPGLLGGTSLANSGRLSVGGKSPLTFGVKESNSGGQPGGRLAALGLRALIFEGAGDKWRKLVLGPKGATLAPCDEAVGLDNYDTAALLRKEHGPDCATITIGRAGELRLSAASIAMSDPDGFPSRHAARGGLGAVMGSKKLKAIVILPGEKKRPPMKRPKDFQRAAEKFAKALLAHPVCGKGLSEYGSAAMMGLFNEMGKLPTRNFSKERFFGFEPLSGEKLNFLTKSRGGEGRVAKACMSGCVMRCAGVFPDKEGGRIGKWPDFETLWAFGPNAEIADLDAVARYDRLCDDIGVDTIDVGVALSILMEAGALKFGDAEGALAAVAQIGEGSPLGRIIGSGAAICGRVYGAIRVAEVKGQALPAFDPRTVKGQGVTFATNPQGADHTAGLAYAGNILGLGESVDPLSPVGQADLSRKAQVLAAAVDSLGLCAFVSFAFFDSDEALAAVGDALSARFGWDFKKDDVLALGERVLAMETEFNRLAGFTEASDRLPEFFREEAVGQDKAVFDVSAQELNKVLKFDER
jgi:aldehyde:ferredoxin oxidoreductase